MEDIYFNTYTSGPQTFCSQVFFTLFNVIEKLKKILFIWLKSTKFSLLEIKIQKIKIYLSTIHFKIAIMNTLIANPKIRYKWEITKISRTKYKRYDFFYIFLPLGFQLWLCIWSVIIGWLELYEKNVVTHI